MSEENFNSRLDLQAIKERIEQVRTEIGRVVIGQHQLIDLMLVALLSDGHVLIEGVPGIAKTLTSKLMARTLGIEFARIQFTPDLMPSDVVGTSVFNMKSGEFDYKKGPIFSNVVLIDEINRAPAKTQSALFEVMEEFQVTVDGNTYPMNLPFLVLATQNPVDQEGTYRLPEAQLDRFIFKAIVDYPDTEDEVKLLANVNMSKKHDDVSKIGEVISAEEITEFRNTVLQVHVEEKLLTYIAQIVGETRENPSLYLGASPRASIALLKASKALAVVKGRDFVTPEDIKYLSKPVLRHRVILTPEREIEGKSTDEIIEMIVNKIEVPR
ncbi:MAG: MoxR family ATPase [Cyclobacteriaceae bacterium]